MQESAGVNKITAICTSTPHFFSPASLTESYSFWIVLKFLIPLDNLDDKDRLSLSIKTDDITWGRKDVDQQRQ